MAYVKNGPMAIAGMVADMSNYTIYTIGDIDFVYTAFNGIALIFHSRINEWLRFAAYAAAIGLFINPCGGFLPPQKTMSRSSLDNGVAVLFHCRN